MAGMSHKERGAKFWSKLTPEERKQVVRDRIARGVFKGFTSADCKKGGRIARSKIGMMNPALAPTRRPTLRDIVLAAGWYEGEGSCAKNVDSGAVNVSQKKRWMCDQLRSAFGGSVRLYSNRWGGYHKWHISGPRARGFLMTIYSLLSPHRKQEIQKVLRTVASNPK